MKKLSCLLALPLTVALFAQQANAGVVVYSSDFNTGTVIGAPGDPLNTVNWQGYVTREDGSVSDETLRDPVRGVDGPTSTSGLAGISSGNATSNKYPFVAPRTETDDNGDIVGNTAVGVDSLLFTTDFTPVDVGLLESMSLNQSFDGIVGAEAQGHFAIQIGSDWYASATPDWIETTENGAPASPNNAGNIETLSGIDFTDASNWLSLNAVVGGMGTGDLSLGSAPAGPLSGNVTGFGVYAVHGNGGDHARFDDFSVTAIPEPTSLGLLAAIGGGMLAVRRRSSK